jgi:uncharacterized integral membrane protein (TIGR00698 family)
LLPGLALAGALAGAATLVATLHGGPQMLYALFFGIALNHLAHAPRTRPGVEFAARSVLRLGVGLLGVRITMAQVAALGWPTVAVVVAAVASTMGLAVLLGRRLGLGRAHSLLAGGAVAICGASAALAIAAVLPRDTKDGARTTLLVVVAVTLLSTLAMVLYPLVVRAFELPPLLGGLFLGGTIHDVAQVVGAGYTVSPATGDTATVVKLFRVALLSVVVASIAYAYRSAPRKRRLWQRRHPAAIRLRDRHCCRGSCGSSSGWSCSIRRSVWPPCCRKACRRCRAAAWCWPSPPWASRLRSCSWRGWAGGQCC